MPPVAAPASRAAREWTRADGARRVDARPAHHRRAGHRRGARGSLGDRQSQRSTPALLALEGEGVVLRGRFTPGADGAASALEWCDRALLARIHRYTLNRLRAEIEPVSPADFMRFLFTWQHVDERTQAVRARRPA